MDFGQAREGVAFSAARASESVDSMSERHAESGFVIEPIYRQAPTDLADRLGEPGEYPYTRGVYPTMYTTKPWTMRQYAGFGTAAESNARYHQLLAAGTAGLSVAFDLPTQMGYDSDSPMSHGEVGKVGVAIDSIDDMRTLFDGIPLDKVSTSMTINAPAAVLLLLYQLVAEEHGVPGTALNGTIQNDILKEYIARGTYIYPPKPSLRVADTFAYRHRDSRWNTISISGYHMKEAGATRPRRSPSPSPTDWPMFAALDAGLPSTTCTALSSRRLNDAGGGREVSGRPPDLGPSHP